MRSETWAAFALVAVALFSFWAWCDFQVEGVTYWWSRWLRATMRMWWGRLVFRVYWRPRNRIAFWWTLRQVRRLIYQKHRMLAQTEYLQTHARFLAQHRENLKGLS